MIQENGIKLATPTADQLAWQDLAMGMFIHYAPNSWQVTQGEGDNLSTPLDKINPTKLDAAQWVDVAEAMGAKFIVFTAKHYGGFCMWPTKTTQYSIANTPWKGGKGDVCRELADECKKRHMPLGFYISPADLHWGVRPGGISRSGYPAHQKLYNQYYSEQLKELFTGYGDLVEVWFDGSADTAVVKPLLERYQPHAMVFCSGAATMRFIGNESGCAPYPTWNTVSSDALEKMWPYCGDPPCGHGPAATQGKDITPVWLPAESCTTSRSGYWFWSPDNAGYLHPVEKMMQIYYETVGRNCVLLMNQTPDPSGLIPERDARRAAQFGAEIRKRLEQPLAETMGDGDELELTLPAAAMVDHIILMEDTTRGERVLQYYVEALDQANNNWVPLSVGSAVGHRKIDVVNASVPTQKVRLKIVKAMLPPAIRKFAVYGTPLA
ncbi:MAG: alpha-L-fucosidase [Lentisphaeria bacterium]